jgi:hypothetical protein
MRVSAFLFTRPAAHIAIMEDEFVRIRSRHTPCAVILRTAHGVCLLLSRRYRTTVRSNSVNDLSGSTESSECPSQYVMITMPVWFKSSEEIDGVKNGQDIVGFAGVTSVHPVGFGTVGHGKPNCKPVRLLATRSASLNRPGTAVSYHTLFHCRSFVALSGYFRSESIGRWVADVMLVMEIGRGVVTPPALSVIGTRLRNTPVSFAGA